MNSGVSWVIFKDMFSGPFFDEDVGANRKHRSIHPELRTGMDKRSSSNQKPYRRPNGECLCGLLSKTQHGGFSNTKRLFSQQAISSSANNWVLVSSCQAEFRIFFFMENSDRNVNISNVTSEIFTIFC